MKVAIIEPPEKNGRDISVERSVCPPDTEFVYALYDRNSDDNSEFYRQVSDADVVIDIYTYLGRREIDAMKKCKCISFQSTGYNEVDLDYATQKGIYVASILDYCTQETAENAMAMMLCLQRATLRYDKLVKVDHLWRGAAFPGLKRIEGQTMGIAGLGRIGQAVAVRAKGFGMDIIAYDPYLPPEVAEKLGVKLVDKDTLLAESDVISIHMNLTDENYHFLNREAFEKCRKKPIIINEGRGPHVCEDDLIWALDNGIVRGAGLDMLESEDPDVSKCRLLDRDDVIINPHSGFYSETSIMLCSKISMENALYCYLGEYDKVKVLRNKI